MAINIIIEVLNDIDYEGNNIQVKSVRIEKDGKLLPISYCFSIDKSDDNIRSEVEEDLLNKGYI